MTFARGTGFRCLDLLFSREWANPRALQFGSRFPVSTMDIDDKGPWGLIIPGLIDIQLDLMAVHDLENDVRDFPDSRRDRNLVVEYQLCLAGDSSSQECAVDRPGFIRRGRLKTVDGIVVKRSQAVLLISLI